MLKVSYFGLFGIALAVAVYYWFLQPSDDEISLHADSLPITATHSVPDTIESNQEFPASESRAQELQSLAPSSKQVDAAFTVTADALGDSSEIGCAQSPHSSIIPGVPDIPAHLQFPFNYHYGASEEQLLKRAMAGDGYAQQVYATRLQVRLITELPDIDFGDADVRGRWIGEFGSMEEMYISAIQNRGVVAARRLGETLLFRTPRRDPIKAAAWLLIEQRMGGNSIVRARNNGFLVLTEDENETSRLLATNYIEEFDLWFLDPAMQPDLMDAESEYLQRQDCVEN